MNELVNLTILFICHRRMRWLCGF